MAEVAEDEYLFRHALVQQAAYALQLPSERAALHGMVVEAVQAILPAVELEARALELAGHAGLAASANPAFANMQLELLCTGEQWAGRNFRLAERMDALAAIAAHPLVTPEARLRAQADLGGVMRLVGRTAEAEALLGTLLDTGDRALLASIVNQLAAIYLRTGRMAEAELEFLRGHDLVKDGDPRLRARALANVALVQFELGKKEECERTLELAQQCAERADDVSMLAQLQVHRGRLFHHAARPDEAEAAYLAAIELGARAGDRGVQAIALGNLAEVQRHYGRPGARERLEQALKLAREVGDRHLEMNTVGNLGLWFQAAGMLQAAEHCVRQACGIARETANEASEGAHLSNLADILHELGDDAAAQAASSQALHIARSHGLARLECSVYLASGLRLRDRALVQRAIDLAADELQREHALQVMRDLD